VLLRGLYFAVSGGLVKPLSFQKELRKKKKTRSACFKKLGDLRGERIFFDSEASPKGARATRAKKKGKKGKGGVCSS